MTSSINIADAVNTFISGSQSSVSSTALESSAQQLSSAINAANDAIPNEVGLAALPIEPPQLPIIPSSPITPPNISVPFSLPSIPGIPIPGFSPPTGGGTDLTQVTAAHLKFLSSLTTFVMSSITALTTPLQAQVAALAAVIQIPPGIGPTVVTPGLSASQIVAQAASALATAMAALAGLPNPAIPVNIPSVPGGSTSEQSAEQTALINSILGIVPSSRRPLTSIERENLNQLLTLDPLTNSDEFKTALFETTLFNHLRTLINILTPLRNLSTVPISMSVRESVRSQIIQFKIDHNLP